MSAHDIEMSNTLVDVSCRRVVLFLLQQNIKMGQSQSRAWFDAARNNQRAVINNLMTESSTLLNIQNEVRKLIKSIQIQLCCCLLTAKRILVDLLYAFVSVYLCGYCYLLYVCCM